MRVLNTFFGKKKGIVILILCIVSAAIRAQTIVPFGDRVEEYYYWDTVWYDNLLSYYPDSEGVVYPYLKTDDLWKGFPSFIARQFMTDVPLRVIGVAAAVKCDDTARVLYPNAPRLQEYFRLYDAGDSGLIFVAEVPWGDSVRYRMCLRHSEGTDTLDVQEAYFSKPIIVEDSFYVGGTTFNNGRCWSNRFMYMYRPTFYATFLPLYSSPVNGLPSPALVVSTSIYQWPYYGMEDSYPPQTDTTGWGYPPSWDIENNSGAPWVAFFPILDLSVPVDTCDTPTGLNVLGQDSTAVTLAWTAADTGRWEVSYGLDSTAADSGTVVQSDINFVTLEGLDTGRHYVAYVRTVCNDTLRSLWSEPVAFYVAGDTASGGGTVEPPDDTIGVASAVDRYIMLMPNPARDRVTVMSSFRLRQVQLFTAAGILVRQSDAEGIATTVDLSGCSKGVYIVRIVTTAGTTVRRLVVD